MCTNKGWQQRGFTLSEMMVVVFIVGILSAIALPMYARYVDNARLTQAKSVALQLQQEVKMLRLKNGDLTADDIEAVNTKAAALGTENGLNIFFEFEAVSNDAGKVFINAIPKEAGKAGLYVGAVGDVFKCADSDAVAAQTGCEKF